MNKRVKGFTIVELLIVIVVIAILATISIVAYNGVQNRAYEAAVRTDLESYGKKISMYRVQNEEEKYPKGPADLEKLRTYASTKAYKTGESNLYYCTNNNDFNKFIIAGRAKSGKVFYYSSSGSGEFPASQRMWSDDVCGWIDVHGADKEYDYGYSWDNTWANWAKRD